MKKAVCHNQPTIDGAESSPECLEGVSLKPFIADSLSFKRAILLVSPKNNSGSDFLLERLLMISLILFSALPNHFDWFI